MRTTLTLNDEVSALLKKILKKKKSSMKEIINNALKVGLLSEETGSCPQTSTKTTTVAHNGGNLLIADISNIGETLARLDEI